MSAPPTLDGKLDPVEWRESVAGKIVKTEMLNLPPGGEKRFRLDEKLPEDVKEGKMSLRATLGDRTLLSCTTPFKVGEYANRIKPVPAHEVAREGDPAAALDYYKQTLTVKDMKPHSGRFIGIGKY